jgi:hypothetical protein
MTAEIAPDDVLRRSFCDGERRIRDECYRIKACRRECDAYYLESGADVAGSDAHMVHICRLDRQQQRLEKLSTIGTLDGGNDNGGGGGDDGGQRNDQGDGEKRYQPRSTMYGAHLRRLELRRVSGELAVAMSECSTARLDFLAVLVRRSSPFSFAPSSSSSSSSSSTRFAH